jgi:hypoxanthine phosphoribosyltransferase
MGYKILATEAEINKLIAKMAADIIKDFGNELPLFVALLRGAAPFAAKLMLEINKQEPNLHPELDYMMVSTYGQRRKSGEPHIVTDLAPDTVVAGRTALILDDVLDKGITANFVSNHLQARGATDIRLAVLVRKRCKRIHEIAPDYYAFELDDVWLVGMGLDDGTAGKEHGRWQSNIQEYQQNQTSLL